MMTAGFITKLYAFAVRAASSIAAQAAESPGEKWSDSILIDADSTRMVEFKPAS